MNEENTTQQTASSTQNFAIPFAIVIAGLAIAAAIYFGDSKVSANVNGNERQAPITINPITEKDHVLGDPSAKIMIVEYSDTECPFCKTFHNTMLQVMGEYGADGKVAWTYRHYPIPAHPKAPKEAEATECVNKLGGNTKFWEYLNKIFEVTPSNNGLDEKELPIIAKGLGIDEVAFNECLTSGEMKTVIDEHMQSGAYSGVTGTPHSIILLNGKPITTIDGALPYSTVKATIDSLLAK